MTTLRWAAAPRERRKPLALVVAVVDLIGGLALFSLDDIETFGRYSGAALVAVPLVVSGGSLAIARGEHFAWRLGVSLGLGAWAVVLGALASVGVGIGAAPHRPHSVDPLLSAGFLAAVGALMLPPLAGVAGSVVLAVLSRGRGVVLVGAALAFVLVGASFFGLRSTIGCWRRFAVDCGVKPPLGEVRLPIVACVERPECLARVRLHHAARELADLRVLLGDDCEERHARSCQLLADAEVELAPTSRREDATRRAAELLTRACDLMPGLCRVTTQPFAPE